MWVGTQPRDQSTCERLDIQNSSHENVKKHAKFNIILLKSCPILLYFFTLCQIVSCARSSKFHGFVLALFYILGSGQNLTLKNFQLY